MIKKGYKKRIMVKKGEPAKKRAGRRG